MKTINLILVLLYLQTSFSTIEAATGSPVPAFNGAEGFGKWARGGRGGTVLTVTNLNDDGKGSLRKAVEAKGPRTVIFKVAGTIRLKSTLKIENPFITISGQTAPGRGICLRDYSLTIEADQVIVRYIRVRPGDNMRKECDSISVIKGNNIILDHLSASWSVDETLSVGPSASNVTIQWCFITESLNNSVHHKGAHGYGALIRGSNNAKITYHHNLFAHHRGRSPRPGNYKDHEEDPEGLLFDFRNNVIYNWGGSHAGYNADKDSVSRYNFINNYYIAGHNSGGNIAFKEDSEYARAYFNGNYMNGSLPPDPWKLVKGNTDEKYKQDHPFKVESVTTHTAPEAYRLVLAGGGCSNNRDSVDRRIVKEVKSKKGHIIDDEEEVGGWPR